MILQLCHCGTTSPRRGLFNHKQSSESADKVRLTDEFECEDTMGHGPLDIILFRGSEVIARQQVHLEEDGGVG